MERYFSRFIVIGLMILVEYSISSASMFSFVIFKMLLHFSQSSKRMWVRAIPEFRRASLHLRCRVELITGACGVNHRDN